MNAENSSKQNYKKLVTEVAQLDQREHIFLQQADTDINTHIEADIKTSKRHTNY